MSSTKKVDDPNLAKFWETELEKGQTVNTINEAILIRESSLGTDKWYGKALEFWNKQADSDDGVLCGFGDLSSSDITGSRSFLKQVYILCTWYCLLKSTIGGQKKPSTSQNHQQEKERP